MFATESGGEAGCSLTVTVTVPGELAGATTDSDVSDAGATTIGAAEPKVTLSVPAPEKPHPVMTVATPPLVNAAAGAMLVTLKAHAAVAVERSTVCTATPTVIMAATDSSARNLMVVVLPVRPAPPSSRIS